MEIRTKTCCKCKQELNISCFQRKTKSKDGLRSECKSCKNADSHKYYKENIDKIKEQQLKYRLENADKNRAKSARWRVVNLAKSNAKDARRYASKVQATPGWLNKEQWEEIEEFYQICIAFRLFTGLTYHVDHIVPIKGKLVCGLHVPWNLQILEARDNISKNNKFEIE